MDKNSNEYMSAFADGQNALKNDHDFIENVIDTYLVVKNDIKDKDFMERHDIISMVIEKLKK